LIKNAIDRKLTNFKIIIPNPEEFEIGEDFENIIDKKIRKKLKSQNITIDFIFGSQDINFYKQSDFLYHSPEHNMFVHLWPTYWFFNSLKYTDYKNFNLKKEKIDYVYCTLNHVGKYHRCLLLDLLVKEDLLKYGAIAWHNFCVDSSYQWKWTNSTEMLVSDSREYLNDNYNKQFIPPVEFFQSFMSIISETTDRTIFITEKTSVALLLKQPFIVQGAPGFHQYLKDIGFKLYDEIFDYSFDSEFDLQTRTEMIIDNVKSILNKNLLDLYNQIECKLTHNRNRLIEITKDKKFSPSIINKNSILKSQYFIDNHDI
jgi:hypothetical protein